MKRRTVLQAGLAAAGAMALGLKEAFAKPKRPPHMLTQPMLELSTTYSPATRPFSLAAMMLAVKPSDFETHSFWDREAEAEAIAKARVEQEAFEAQRSPETPPQFELYSCPILRWSTPQIVDNFRVGVEHYLASQGRTPVLTEPVDFTFHSGNGPWLETNPRNRVVVSSHDIFVERSYEAIQNAVRQQAMHFFITTGLREENTRVSSDWREGAKRYEAWLIRQQKHLTAVGVKFYVR